MEDVDVTVIICRTPPSIPLIAMLFETPSLTTAERAVLGKIDEVQGKIGYAVQTPKRWPGLIRRVTFARAVRGSNSIEGYNVTVEDAIAAAEGDEPLEASEASWKAVLGYQQAMTYVLQLADDLHFTYSADLLKSLHFMMMQHELTKNPGRWRPGPIFVYDADRDEQVYEGPPEDQVPALIHELVRRLTDDRETPTIVRAAMAHLNLVMIHPFSDGNGRMARCLQTLVIARGGEIAPAFASIEEYLGRNTRSYYDVLAEVGGGSWQPDRDARPWLRFCLVAHYRQAMTVLRRMRELQKIWDRLEREVARRELPERSIFALADAAMGLRVKNASYRTVAEITAQTASRDLGKLVDHELLVPRGEKRGRFYVGSEWVGRLRADAAEPKLIPDPFDEVREEEMLLPGFDGDAV